MGISAMPIEVCGAASKDMHSNIGRVTRADTAMERGNARCQAAITVLYFHLRTAIWEVVSPMRLEGKVVLISGGARGVANGSCAGLPHREKEESLCQL
jgi:hypothetical protein